MPIKEKAPLTKRQEKVLNVIRNRPDTNHYQIAKRLRITPAAALGRIRGLEKKGYIKRVPAHWEIR